jgi:short-subunit dehydrogenase
MSKLDLKQATAIVTGGSRGIGPHIASALANRGAHVALVARSQFELEANAAKLRESGGEILAITADVTSPSDRRELLVTVERELGPVDVLVNNAGGDPQREFHNLSEEQIEQVLELNLTSAVLLTRLVLPGMLARERGHIVNISSMAGRTSFPHTEAYGAAKDGLIGFGRVLRGDYRRHGVSASTLILGPIRDAGVGHRTAQEVGIKLPPKPFTIAPEAIGTATVRAIVKDRAEIALLPGPGKAMRAVMDRFPGLGPCMNRISGVESSMQTVAQYREREAQLAQAERTAAAWPRP